MGYVPCGGGHTGSRKISTGDQSLWRGWEATDDKTIIVLRYRVDSRV